MMRLRSPAPEEAAALSDLCLRSKAVWGYDEAFLKACRAELALTPGDFLATHVAVAERDGAIVGVAQISVEGERADLAKLFVEPEGMRTGVGRLLYDWALARARAAGAARMTIDADPGAAAFYTRMGAREIGVALSGSIPGRVLPRFAVDLA